MYTILYGTTNFVVHIQNAMNQILKQFVLKRTILFVDDVPIKGFKEDAKNETLDEDGYLKFVSQYIKDVNKFLIRMEEVGLTFFIDKSKFRVSEI